MASQGPNKGQAMPRFSLKWLFVGAVKDLTWSSWLFLLLLSLAAVWYVVDLIVFFATPGYDGKRPSLKQFWQWNGVGVCLQVGWLVWVVSAVTVAIVMKPLQFGKVTNLAVGIIVGGVLFVLFGIIADELLFSRKP